MIEGKFEEALKVCDLAIKHKSDFAAVYYNKGITLEDLGRFEEAVKAYDLAIKYKPDFTQAINNKNKILKNKANIR